MSMKARRSCITLSCCGDIVNECKGINRFCEVRRQAIVYSGHALTEEEQIGKLLTRIG